MTETTHDEVFDDDRVGAILQAWIGRKTLGNAETVEQLIQQHPQLGPRLRDCIESLDFLESSGLIDSSVSAVAYPTIPDFEILGELGRGGMGIVYEARQISLDRIVALKILPNTSVDPLAAQRFQREAETAAALHHTHIVPIHAVGRSEGVHWYAMQRIEGRPLNQLFRESPHGVEPDEVARIGIEAAEALAMAHHHGVVHRDIKPANLLIQPDGHVWLTDFGLARRDADTTATITGAMVGTPRYMSPEQVFAPQGASLDHRSDIYSLGATLYELVTGAVLFDGESPLDVLQQIRVAEPVKPRSIRPSIPRDLEIVLQKCLAKEPKERYQSASDLAADLRAIREGRPIKARGIPAWLLAYRRIQRHRVQLKLAVAAVLGTAAMIGMTGLWLEHKQTIGTGRLRIDSVSDSFVASIYAADRSIIDRQPVATTIVPMIEPLRLPPGDYEVSLSSHAMHSEVARLEVSSGDDASDITRARYIDRRARTEGIRYGDQQLTIVRGVNDSEVLATLDQTEFAVYGKHTALQFRTELSEIAIDDQQVDFSYSLDDEYAGNRTATDPYFVKPRRVMASTVDLNDDGLDEFVLSARVEPAIAAITDSGELLWASRIQLPEPANSLKGPPKGQPGKRCPAVIDLVSTSDIDSDSIDDLVVTLVRCIDRSDVEAFLATVSGRNGKTIALASLPIEKPNSNRPRRPWPLDGTLLHLHSNRDNREISHVNSFNRTYYRSWAAVDHPLELLGAGYFSMTLPVPPPVHLATFEDKRVAVRVTDQTLDAWDLKTGKQVGATAKIPFSIAARPMRVNTDAGSPPSFLLWSQQDTKQPTSQTMALYVLGEQEPRWTKQVGFHWTSQANQLERCDFPLVADLDGDGVDEILVPENQFGNWKERHRLNCFDSITGTSKWNQSPRIDSLERMAERGAVMRDFNGDGVREVAVVTIMARGHGNPPWQRESSDSNFSVFVDLFSGADGKRIGGQHASFEAPHPMKFVCGIDRLCSDGDTKLEASVVSGYYETAEYEATTICFDLSRSGPAKITRGVSRIGLPDSAINEGFFLQRPGIDRYYDSRVLWLDRDQSNSQTRIDANSLLASWVTPKGEPRLLLKDSQTFRTRVVDVNTGRTLWSRSFESGQIHATPVAFDSIAGSTPTASDVLLQVLVRGETTTQLVDSDSGRIRWTLPTNLGLIDRAFQTEDSQNGNTSPQDTILIYGYASYFHTSSNSNARGMRLLSVQKETGNILWSISPLSGLKPSQYGSRPQISVLRIDCNGDGVRDMVIPDDSEKDDGNIALVAYSGADGSRLWMAALNLPTDRWSEDSPWPMMVVCGPENSKRLVVLDRADQQTFAIRMLSLASGQELVRHVLPAQQKLRTDQAVAHYSFEFFAVDPTEPWPELLIKYPGGRARAIDSWQRVKTSSDEIVDLDELEGDQPVDHTWFFADADGNGRVNKFTMHDGKLSCLDDDDTTTLWERKATPYRKLVRLFRDPKQPPLALLMDENEKDALVDLRNGNELWTRASRIDEKNDLNDLPAMTTPIVQSTKNGTTFVSVTRENVMWNRLAMESNSEASSSIDYTVNLGSDRRTTVRLPSSPLATGASLSKLAVEFFSSIMFALFAVCLPFTYLYRLFRRQFTLSFLMMAPVVAIPAILTWRQALAPMQSGTAANVTVYTIVSGTISLLVIRFLFEVVHRRHRWIAGLIVLSTIVLTFLMIAVPLVFGLFDADVRSYEWGMLDVFLIAVICLLGVSLWGLPVWGVMMYVTRRKQKRNREQARLQEA